MKWNIVNNCFYKVGCKSFVILILSLYLIKAILKIGGDLRFHPYHCIEKLQELELNRLDEQIVF